MKTIKILKCALIVLSISFFTSCSSDDAPKAQTNEIKINSNSFEVTKATILNSYSNDGITEFELFLTSSGLTVNNDNNLTGNGDYLYLRLYSNSQDKITAGNYVYNDQDNNSFLLNSSYHFLDYNSSEGDGQTGDVDIELGSVTIALNNDEYTITVNLTDENDAQVTGYYKGKIDGFNE